MNEEIAMQDKEEVPEKPTASPPPDPVMQAGIDSFPASDPPAFATPQRKNRKILGGPPLGLSPFSLIVILILAIVIGWGLISLLPGIRV
jgi:hypothetical protein